MCSSINSLLMTVIKNHPYSLEWHIAYTHTHDKKTINSPSEYYYVYACMHVRYAYPKCYIITAESTTTITCSGSPTAFI